jgi:hypothetical protein
MILLIKKLKISYCRLLSDDTAYCKRWSSCSEEVCHLHFYTEDGGDTFSNKNVGVNQKKKIYQKASNVINAIVRASKFAGISSFGRLLNPLQPSKN